MPSSILVTQSDGKEYSIASQQRPEVRINSKQRKQLKALRSQHGFIRAPLASEKRDGKRTAHRYAEKRVGHRLSWRQAKRLLDRWGREERAATQAATEQSA